MKSKLDLITFLRFSTVSFVGVIIDFICTIIINYSSSLDITLATTFGFLVGMIFNYLAHKKWTFSIENLNHQQVVKYFILVSIITYLTRIMTIYFMENLSLVKDQNLIIILCAFSISFTVSYILNKRWVFISRISRSKPKQGTGNSVDMIKELDFKIPSYREDVINPKFNNYILVIPVLNEGELIKNQLRSISALSLDVDVVIADGGSSDGSLDFEFLRSVNVRALLTKTGQGKLSAQLRMAYAWCIQEEYHGIITIDGNGKDSIESIPLFVQMLKKGFDYIQGSRYLPTGKAINNPIDRTIGNRLIHSPLISIAGKYRFTDTTNGFRAYSRKYLLDTRVKPFRSIFINYELLFYLSVRAGQIGARICEIPVSRIYPSTGKTPTKINGYRGKLEIFIQLINVVLGRYKPH